MSMNETHFHNFVAAAALAFDFFANLLAKSSSSSSSSSLLLLLSDRVALFSCAAVFVLAVTLAAFTVRKEVELLQKYPNFTMLVSQSTVFRMAAAEHYKNTTGKNSTSASEIVSTTL